jgi:hypothetical protein
MWRRTDGDPLFSPRLPPAPWLVDAATVHEVDVELVEDAEPSSSGAPGGRRGTVVGPGVTRRGRGLLTVTALGLAGALVLGLNVATETRSTAAAARLAEVPGVLETVRTPGPTWMRTDVLLLGVVEDVVLVSSVTHMVEALDARTGAVRWTVGEAGASGWCTLLADDLQGIQFERTVPWLPGGRRQLACHRSGWWSDGPEDTLRRRTRVELVDAVTGRTTSAVEEDGRLVTSLLLDGDLVPVVAHEDGTVVVNRWDPRTGAPVWRTVSSPGVATPDAVGTAVLHDARTLTVRGQTRTTVALADGVPLPSHLPVVIRRVPASSPRGALVTDAAEPAALVHRPGGTRVVVPGAGRAVRELWRVPAGGRATVVAEVGGVLLLGRTAEAVAHDRRTGSVLWRTETAAGVEPVPLTDGDVVLLPVPGSGTTDLAALRLSDGFEVWRVPLPRGTRLLVPADSAVVVQARDGVVGVPVSP